MGLIFLVFSALQCFLPETHNDGLIYHLGVPLFWLLNHGMADFSSIPHAHFPYGGELFLFTVYLLQGTETAHLLKFVRLVRRFPRGGRLGAGIGRPECGGWLGVRLDPDLAALVVGRLDFPGRMFFDDLFDSFFPRAFPNSSQEKNPGGRFSDLDNGSFWRNGPFRQIHRSFSRWNRPVAFWGCLKKPEGVMAEGTGLGFAGVPFRSLRDLAFEKLGIRGRPDLSLRGFLV